MTTTTKKNRSFLKYLWICLSYVPLWWLTIWIMLFGAAVFGCSNILLSSREMAQNLTVVPLTLAITLPGVCTVACLTWTFCWSWFRYKDFNRQDIAIPPYITPYERFINRLLVKKTLCWFLLYWLVITYCILLDISNHYLNDSGINIYRKIVAILGLSLLSFLEVK